MQQRSASRSRSPRAVSATAAALLAAGLDEEAKATARRKDGAVEDAPAVAATALAASDVSYLSATAKPTVTEPAAAAWAGHAASAIWRKMGLQQPGYPSSTASSAPAAYPSASSSSLAWAGISFALVAGAGGAAGGENHGGLGEVELWSLVERLNLLWSFQRPLRYEELFEAIVGMERETVLKAFAELEARVKGKGVEAIDDPTGAVCAALGVAVGARRNAPQPLLASQVTKAAAAAGTAQASQGVVDAQILQASHGMDEWMGWWLWDLVRDMNRQGGYRGRLNFNTVQDAAKGLNWQVISRVVAVLSSQKQDVADPNTWLCSALTAERASTGAQSIAGGVNASANTGVQASLACEGSVGAAAAPVPGSVYRQLLGLSADPAAAPGYGLGQPAQLSQEGYQILTDNELWSWVERVNAGGTFQNKLSYKKVREVSEGLERQTVLQTFHNLEAKCRLEEVAKPTNWVCAALCKERRLRDTNMSQLMPYLTPTPGGYTNAAAIVDNYMKSRFNIPGYL